MNKNDSTMHSGYYLVTIRPRLTGVLLTSNNERAFIITCLQDLLANHGVLSSPQGATKLATHIDLLAFSITKEAVQLVMFSIAYRSVGILTTSLTSQLLQYQSDIPLYATRTTQAINPNVAIRKLVGPHDALHTSIAVHLNHSDWEFDRYSSIGFYLHDRRGDWARLWRLSYLYENNPDNYRQLMTLALQRNSALTAPALSVKYA